MHRQLTNYNMSEFVFSIKGIILQASSYIALSFAKVKDDHSSSGLHQEKQVTIWKWMLKVIHKKMLAQNEENCFNHQNLNQRVKWNEQSAKFLEPTPKIVYNN